MEKGLVGGEECWTATRNAFDRTALQKLLELFEEDLQQIKVLDGELRRRLLTSKRNGRKLRVYPAPFLGAAAALYDMGYSIRQVCEAVNTLTPQHKIDEETLRDRFVEAGVKLRQHAEAVRKATLKGPRKPPKDTVQMAYAAALVQADAAVRIKGKTMLELIVNTPYEAFARTIAKLLQEHGTVSLGARKYTEDYYEWQLIIRLDLKDWSFLVDCKKSMTVPDFVKTDEELRAYLAMMLACEGYITLQAVNRRRTENPTTMFTVVVLTNTNRELVGMIEDILKRHGYDPSTIIHVRPRHQHVDKYGRRYTAKLMGYRLSLNRRDDVQRFLEWLGPVLHPVKEAYRAWTLRLLRQANGMPIRWADVRPLKDWLDRLSDISAKMGRQRAKMYFEKTQEEMNSGRRIDRRPLKAQTAPHHQTTKRPIT